MSVHVSSWVWNRAKCGGNELVALLALADMANDDGECWPSVPTLAARCRCNDRTVQKNLKNAQERGEIEIIQRRCENGESNSNFYRFRKYAGGGGNLPGGGERSATVGVNVAPPKTSYRTVSSSESVSSKHLLQNLEGDGFSEEQEKNKKLKPSDEDFVYRHLQAQLDLTLQTSSFINWLRQWIPHRLHRPEPTLRGFELEMMTCKNLGEERAIAAIKNSIASGYRNIIEPKSYKNIPEPPRHGPRSV
jgi:Helix-turn-helix domain